MKRYVLVMALLGAMAAPVSRAALVLRYNFDESSSGTDSATDSGAAPAAPGTLSGSAARIGNTPGGASIGALDVSLPNSFVTAGDVEKLDGLSQFTLTGWINLQGTPGHGNRIMSKQVPSGNFDGFSFALNNPTGGATERRADNFQLNMALGGAGGFAFHTSGADLGADNQWVFVAATYDGTQSADNLRFYSGDTLLGVTQLGNASSVIVGSLLANDMEFKVAAQSAGTVSPPAWFDDIRVYDQVLSAAELEAVRLENVPEPGSLALLALGAMALMKRRCGR